MNRRVKDQEILAARPHRIRERMEVEFEVEMKGGQGIMQRRTTTVKVSMVKRLLHIENPRKYPHRMVGRMMPIPELQNEAHKQGFGVPKPRVRERCY